MIIVKVSELVCYNMMVLGVGKISYDPPEVNGPVRKDRHTVDLDIIDCWLYGDRRTMICTQE